MRRSAVWTLGLLASGVLACSSTDQGKLPPNVQDPTTLQTPSGAVARYRGALAALPEAFDRFLTETGILTDELADLPAPLGGGGNYTVIDSRQDLSGFDTAYAQLHRIRAQAREARGFLQAYAPDSSPALAGHLYAMEGYAEVLLADLFCSGIPLSTVNFNGDYTLAPGSSTTDVYRHAVTLFDSALALVSDSVRFQYLAAIGRGRALLALGQYADAATAVAAVPNDYLYQIVFTPVLIGNRLLQLFTSDQAGGYQQAPATPSVGNHEGGNGLDYRSSDDPRSRADSVGQDILDHTLWFPDKYPQSGSVTLTVADGIEARLIEAEAALQAGSADWITRLNALRTDSTFDTQPNANDPSLTDTLWHAGIGGVPGLRPLDDPGADARVDLVFRERAFWLYLTGHRQGDLRRLIRVYLRTATTVYPTGFYQGGSGAYGSEIVAPVPSSEQDLNPKYTGCLHHNA